MRCWRWPPSRRLCARRLNPSLPSRQCSAESPGGPRAPAGTTSVYGFGRDYTRLRLRVGRERLAREPQMDAQRRDLLGGVIPDLGVRPIVDLVRPLLALLPV